MTQELEIRFIQSSESENSPVYVSSREVAKKFGKEHKNVLQALETAISYAGLEQFGRLNFKPSSYVNEQGKTQPEMLMTRDGFCYIAMGFIGEEAAIWKVKFLEAFDKLVLSASQLRAENQALKTANAKLLVAAKPKNFKKSKVAMKDKTVEVWETVEGKSKLVKVLASSLTKSELAEAIAAKRDAQARGTRSQARAARKWANAVWDWETLEEEGVECPNPLDYVNSCEYSGFFNVDEEDCEDEELC